MLIIDIVVLLSVNLSWAANETSDGCTFCLRMKLKHFPAQEEMVVIESRELQIIINVFFFLHFVYEACIIKSEN